MECLDAAGGEFSASRCAAGTLAAAFSRSAGRCTGPSIDIHLVNFFVYSTTAASPRHVRQR
jgi:hypothetical protein